MNVEVINAVVNDKGNLEVVKEITDDEGNVVYELHVIPKNAIVNNAVQMGIENPDEAVDVALFSPYVGEEDESEDEDNLPVDKVRRAKDRLKSKGPKNKSGRQNNLTMVGVPEKYHPIEGIDPLDVIRAHGAVSYESLHEARERVKKEKENDGHSGEPKNRGNRPSRKEPSGPEEGRSGPRRAYISLGTTD